MDELGFNKLAAAVLGTALAFMGVRTLAEFVVPEHDFEAIYVPEVDLGGAVEAVEADPTFNHPDFIAAMDVARGEKVFKKCQSCHNADKGGANGTGPNMWGVMGRQMGTHNGFAYSAAMQSKAAPWTWEEMNGFLIKPQDWLPGTAMNYIGLKKWEDRAAVMAYLNTKTDNPITLPEPMAVEVDVVEAGLIEPGELPTSDPGTSVLNGDVEDRTTMRMTDPTRAEEIDTDTVDIVEAIVGDDEDGADEVEREAPDSQSAGQVEPEDLTPAVADAIDGEEPEVEDGPMQESDVLEFLNRRPRSE